MNRLHEEQLQNNVLSAGSWDSYRGHRDRVSGLLLGTAATADRTLCILGAGNCNDLDLASLLSRYSEVHLVDLDGAAVLAGLARQGLAGDSRIKIHGDYDVTGSLATMANWSRTTVVGERDLNDIVRAPTREAHLHLPRAFDVVASTCVLSQLVHAIVEAVGSGHPRFLDLVSAVRTAHLKLLLHLVRPGGAALLMADFVSSDTLPALRVVPEPDLAQTLVHALRSGNFFHGLDPADLRKALRSEPSLNAELASLDAIPPWRWDFGLRVYAVYAFKLTRR